MKIPAKFRQTGFLDLLADAAFQIRLARATKTAYIANRHARASIIASAFSVESCANCLLDDLSLSAPLLQELEKLPPLAKFEFYVLASKCKTQFSRSRAEVGRIKELISIRNGFVHPKISDIESEMGEWREDESTIEWDIEFETELHGSTAIPKQPFFWSLDDAIAALGAVLAFFRYVFVDLLEADNAEVRRLLCHRAEIICGSSNILIEPMFDELAAEFSQAAFDGFDFAFLGHPTKNKSKKSGKLRKD